LMHLEMIDEVSAAAGINKFHCVHHDQRRSSCRWWHAHVVYLFVK